jgi:LysB family phage lysis regulatory protein
MTFLEPYLAKIGIALASIAACVALWFYVQSLRSDVKVASDAATAAQRLADDRAATISDMQQKQKEQADALNKLDEQRGDIAAKLAKTQSDFEELKRENSKVAKWASHTAPDAVGVFYSRPAVRGYAAYAAMRASESVQPVGGDGQDK